MKCDISTENDFFGESSYECISRIIKCEQICDFGHQRATSASHFDSSKSIRIALALTLSEMKWSLPSSLLGFFISFPHIPWKVLTHTENLVKSACKGQPLTNVCKKQKSNESFLGPQTKYQKFLQYPSPTVPKESTNYQVHVISHLWEIGRACEILQNGQCAEPFRVIAAQPDGPIGSSMTQATQVGPHSNLTAKTTKKIHVCGEVHRGPTLPLQFCTV